MTERREVPSGTAWGEIVGYSHAVRHGALIHVAGTTAALPDGGVVGEDDPGAQTTEVLRRISAALNELGAELTDVVRTRIFVTDIDDWEAIGRAHARVFGDVRPAATMVEVSRLIAPDLLVEIEADAVVSPTNPDGH